MAGLRTPLPTLRPGPRGPTRTARGRCGSLLLHRGGLAPPTSRRSPGAHPNNSSRYGGVDFTSGSSSDGSGGRGGRLGGRRRHSREAVAERLERGQNSRMRELPTTRYAQSGELNIAYQVMGDGPVDLILVPGMITHLEFLHEFPGYTDFLRRLAAFARVVTF